MKYLQVFLIGERRIKMDYTIKLQSKNEKDYLEFEQSILNLDLKFEKLETDGFDGTTELIILILGSGTTVALINAIKDIVIKFIEKDSTKSITVNDITISGYNKRNANKLLEKCFSKKDVSE